MGVNLKWGVCESDGGCRGVWEGAQFGGEKRCCFCCLLKGVIYAFGMADRARSTAAMFHGFGIWKEKRSCMEHREGIT